MKCSEEDSSNESRSSDVCSLQDNSLVPDKSYNFSVCEVTREEGRREGREEGRGGEKGGEGRREGRGEGRRGEGEKGRREKGCWREGLLEKVLN